MRKFLNSIILAAGIVALTSEAIAQSVEWNVSLWGKRRAFTEHIEKMAELVSAKTDGQFTLNISYGGLSKSKENLDGISIGAFEMAQFCAGYHPDKNPSITVMELPFLGISTIDKERRVSQALYQHPAVKADFARWNATLLMPTPQPQYNVLGVGTPPLTLNDYEGMRARAPGGSGVALKSIGGIPTSMSATEVRPALDAGVITAVAFAPHAHMAFGTVESGKWWTTNLNPGTVNCPVVVNTQALNDLPESYRQALLGSIDASLDHFKTNYEGKTMDAWWPLLKEKGITSITYGDDEIAALRKAVAVPAAEAWVKENTAKGIPAQEIYDFVTQKIAE